jgi:hypothetical protein
MTMTTFRDAWGGGGFGITFGHSGDSPAPFDARSSSDLAGPENSHPLADISIESLLRPGTDGLSGSIEFATPVRIGEGIKGTIRVTANRAIDARKAEFRLIGLNMVEERKHTEQRDSKGNVTSKDDWVEANGRLFDELSFMEVVLPAKLAAGESYETTFNIPAPRLGPPQAHVGCAIIAWAIEARWDIPHGDDERIAALVPVAQHPDLLRAGVINVGAGAMHDVWSTPEGASISVQPVPPLTPGVPVAVTVTWLGAPSNGRSGRIEVIVEVDAPNGGNQVIATTQTTADALRGGVELSLVLPEDMPPTLDADRIKVRYLIKAIVDIRFRPDASTERLIVVS